MSNEIEDKFNKHFGEEPKHKTFFKFQWWIIFVMFVITIVIFVYMLVVKIPELKEECINRCTNPLISKIDYDLHGSPIITNAVCSGKEENIWNGNIILGRCLANGTFISYATRNVIDNITQVNISINP